MLLLTLEETKLAWGPHLPLQARGRLVRYTLSSVLG